MTNKTYVVYKEVHESGGGHGKRKIGKVSAKSPSSALMKVIDEYYTFPYSAIGVVFFVDKKSYTVVLLNDKLKVELNWAFVMRGTKQEVDKRARELTRLGYKVRKTKDGFGWNLKAKGYMNESMRS